MQLLMVQWVISTPLFFWRAYSRRMPSIIVSVTQSKMCLTRSGSMIMSEKSSSPRRR